MNAEIPNPESVTNQTILENGLQIGEAIIVKRIPLSELIDEISLAADQDEDSLKLANLDQAITEVRTEHPELQNASWIAALAGDKLWSISDLAAAAYQYAFAEEEFFFDRKAGYARNYILTATNYMVEEVDDVEKAQRLSWLSKKRNTLAEAITWVSHYKDRVSAHGMNPDDLKQSFDYGLYLLQLTNS